MTINPTYPGYQDMPPLRKHRFKLWHGIVLGAIALITICVGFTAVVGLMKSPVVDKPVPAQVMPVPSSTVNVPPAQPVTVKGKNAAVVQIGSVLNGSFTVDYSFGSWCGIANFMTADGENGAGFMETVNDCASTTDEKLAGSTVVHLKNVTMIKVENTRGNWTLTFKPIGI